MIKYKYKDVDLIFRENDDDLLKYTNYYKSALSNFDYLTIDEIKVTSQEHLEAIIMLKS